MSDALYRKVVEEIVKDRTVQRALSAAQLEALETLLEADEVPAAEEIRAALEAGDE